jgi:hypothetical protein
VENSDHGPLRGHAPRIRKRLVVMPRKPPACTDVIKIIY